MAESGEKKARKRRRYTEGWVEFADKSLGKRVAASYNNTPVGGKKHSRHFDTLWNIKYLHRCLVPTVSPVVLRTVGPSTPFHHHSYRYL